MALQALAKYGAATYSEDGNTVVTVTSLGGLYKEFQVNQRNRLLYQEEDLSEVPGEYTVRAEGESCVLAQVGPQNIIIYIYILDKGNTSPVERPISTLVAPRDSC